MSEFYKIYMDPTALGGGSGATAPGTSEGGSGPSVSTSAPASPTDYSGVKGSFSRQQEPTTAREALEPRTESRGNEVAGEVAEAPSAPPSQQPSPSPWTAIREAAKGMGVDLPQDDQAALHALVGAYQNAGRRDYYSELGAAIAPEYDQFQKWKAEQQAAQQAPAEQVEGPWNPPQFDPGWLRVVEEDPQTGRLRSKAGYDPRIGEACQAYADYISTEQRSLWEDPPGWLAKMVGPTVRQMIQEGINGSFQGYQEQVQANSIIQRNMEWLYAKGANGQPLIDPRSGRPQLSPHGTRYYQYVEQAAGWGLRDINQQHEYAMSMVERDAYRDQNRPAPQQAPSQAPPGAVRAPNVNQLQTMVPAERQHVQPTVQGPTGLSLAEMLRQEFRNSGYTDQRLREEMAMEVSG